MNQLSSIEKLRKRNTTKILDNINCEEVKNSVELSQEKNESACNDNQTNNTSEINKNNDIPNENTINDDTLPSSSSSHFKPKSNDASQNYENEKMCRICFSYETEPDDRLISPCKCKGTMKFVHLGCLNEWRRVSRKKESFFQCDHCLYKYHFGRTRFAKLIMNEVLVTILTILIFVLAVFLSGFITKLFLMWVDEEPYIPDDVDTEIPNSTWQHFYTLLEKSMSPTSIWSIDISHFLSGLIGVGIFGCTSLVFSLFSGGGIGGFGFGGGGIYRSGRSSDNFGSVVMIVLVIVGVVKTLYSIYGVVRVFSRSSLKIVENIILEVQEDQ
ncbi:hypothetical protein HK099_000674 [Clydaea vesicula]|uniref:RING-CH-type domain-containing protein n=1 Tax=Clydaea vesicula TaxID=447962 RepID=A0AAD5XWE9_9FUNG|nr:hypothetical protein HK099_000674 [Clydaea vesicula]KAJ3377380.1 hypothetical protein HDU92_008338 [Lobulomyces angularis]